MKLLGAEVREVDAGSRTLKDAINEALRDWVTRVRDTHYVLGSVLGPASIPDDGARFPSRDRASRRARSSSAQAGGLPDLLVACVGGGSNAIGLFHAFLGDATVRKVGVEAGGLGLATRHATRRASPSPSVGVLHGTRTLVLQDERRHDPRDALGLGGPRLPGARPRARVARTSSGRAEYSLATDAEAIEAFEALARLEGILPALESAHALAWVLREGKKLGRDCRVIVNLSGRGDKDVEEVLRLRDTARSESRGA